MARTQQTERETVPYPSTAPCNRMNSQAGGSLDLSWMLGGIQPHPVFRPSGLAQSLAANFGSEVRNPSGND
jgi:hypothetical protein